MNGRQFFELLARLPARVWLQAALGLIGFAALLVLGFALIAGVAAVVLLTILAFKAKAWLQSLFAGPSGVPTRVHSARRVIDVHYEVVDPNKDH